MAPRLLLCLASLAVLSSLARVYGRRVIRAAPGSATTGCYVVKLKDSVNHEQFMAAVRQVTPLAMESKLYTKVEGVVNLFTMKLSHAAADKVKKLAYVEYVEEETIARGSQTCAIPWQLDRLDQTSSTLNCRYDPLDQGDGTDIYILDSGINFDHTEFENRARYPGYDPTDAYHARVAPSRPIQNGRDCHGHGTHVASLAAGRKSGTAPKAHVKSVRVLECTNSGPWSVVIDGLNYAVQQINASGRPSVVSMSLSGNSFNAMDDAVRNAHSMGVTVVVAASNDRNDACNYSPARSPYAITVGGTAHNRYGDRLYVGTNFGSCVDVFAPGENIPAAGYPCIDCSRLRSGTSMAAPIVSGVVAIMLQRQPRLTPNQVKDSIIRNSLANAIANFTDIPVASLRASTPNRLVQVTGSCGGDYTIDNTQTQTIQSPNYPNLYPNNTRCTWRFTASQDRQIVLTFAEISLESRHDRLSVYNGHCTDASSVITSYSASVSGRPQHHSEGNTLTVQLYTDPLIAARGFQATVSSRPRPVTDQPSTTSTSAPTTSAPTSAPTTSAPVTCPTTSTVNTVAPSARDCNITKSIESFKANLLKTMEGILVDGIQYVANVAEKPCSDNNTNTSIPSLETIINLGASQETPADSCYHLHGIRSHLVSGDYWVKADNINSSVRVYCDMEKQFSGNHSQGWARVAYLNMTNPTERCPGDLALVNISQIRSCGRGRDRGGCSSAFFPTGGIRYSKVCGRVRGYQHSSPNAFYINTFRSSLNINDHFVDGAILTYNNGNGREHIWTFAGALDETERTQAFGCPCSNPLSSASFEIPAFVGNDYFCETGSRTNFQYDRFYNQDPLWDAAGCGNDSTCCQRGGPYFCKTLPTTTSSDLEIRICGNEVLTNEDTPVDIVELYVQ